MLAITKSSMAKELSYIRHFRKNSEILNHRQSLISSIDKKTNKSSVIRNFINLVGSKQQENILNPFKRKSSVE